MPKNITLNKVLELSTGKSCAIVGYQHLWESMYCKNLPQHSHGPYQYPYNKALGKEGILSSHAKNAVHHVQAEERADLFRQNYRNPEARVDTHLLKQQDKQVNDNKEILHHIVMAVEFLANKVCHLEAIGMIE